MSPYELLRNSWLVIAYSLLVALLAFVVEHA